jgi:hypothetical protein
MRPPKKPPSRAAYLAAYRKRRKTDPVLRIHKKLTMLRPRELTALERAINTMLGPKRLPVPENPWIGAK